MALALYQRAAFEKDWGRTVEDEMWRTKIAEHMQVGCFSLSLEHMDSVRWD